MLIRILHRILLTLGLIFVWEGSVVAQSNRNMLLDEEWDTYSQTDSRTVNGWDFCKAGIDDESIVQRGNLHAFLSTGSTEGSGTTIATPWLAQVADTFSFYIYGSRLNGHTAQVEFGFIPDNAVVNNPSDICTLFVPYDTVTLSVQNQWQRTTLDMHPYYAIHGTTHRFAIRLLNNHSQELYLDEIRAWIPMETPAQNCPNRTNKGRDFWVMFLYNHNYNSGSHTEEQRVYIIGDQATTVNITNNTSGTTTANLTAPTFSAMQPCGSRQRIVASPYNGGYHIISTEDIWVYANDFIDHNQDAALILPTEALGTRYIVQDYLSTNDRGAEVGFVATQDSTILTMTVPCNILNTSITAGTTLTVNLNSGQTYMLMAVANGSFSGMEVSSNGKPFAMFVAGQNTAVPNDGSGRDYTYEQALPVDLWGTEFIVSCATDQGYNRIRITASTSGCTIYNSGTLLAGPLQAGQTWEGNMPSSSQWHITASSPVQVILYLGSYQTAGNIGDPSAITIPPTNRGICDTRFKNINTPEIPANKHYINIICHQDYDAGLMLDGSPLPDNGNAVILDNFRCHSFPLAISNSNQGLHHLENNLGPFIAYTYGLGSWESYGYYLGIAIDTLTIQQPEPQVHRDTVYISDSVCQGEFYMAPGFIVHPSQTEQPGLVTVVDSTVVDDTIIHYKILNLTVLPTSSSDAYSSIIAGDTLFYNGTAMTTAGDYTFVLTAANGCDSIVTFHLSYQGISLTSSADGVCPGESVTLSVEGTHLVLWSSTPYDPELDSQQGQNPVTVHPEVTTTYHLLDGAGNIIASVTVGVEPPPTLCIEANRDFIDFDHPVITLYDCSPESYSSTWLFSDGHTQRGERARRQFRPPLPDTITVTLLSCNRYNCCADTTIGFHPEIRSVWFPNIFTPDEGQNNRFGCITSCQVAEFEIYLYNRWGLLVWYSTDILDSWDGTHDGTPVPQGAYAYRWFLKDLHGDRWNGAGTVTLIR